MKSSNLPSTRKFETSTTKGVTKSGQSLYSKFPDGLGALKILQ